MSVKAVSWALKQPVGHSPAKFVLVAMAQYAGDDMTSWPSVTALVADTCQNRKTVIANVKRLVDMGYLKDTGKRKGDTGRIVIYQLSDASNSTNTGTIETVPETEPLNSTESGTVDENQIVPDSTCNSPNLDIKQSLKVPVIVPISSTEPSEPSIGTIRTIKPARGASGDLDLPEWMSVEAWSMWDRFRKKKDPKAWTVDAKKLSIRELGKMQAKGMDHVAIIEQSVQRGWTGLFPLRAVQQTALPNKHGDFKERKYVGTDTTAVDWIR